MIKNLFHIASEAQSGVFNCWKLGGEQKFERVLIGRILESVATYIRAAISPSAVEQFPRNFGNVSIGYWSRPHVIFVTEADVLTENQSDLSISDDFRFCHKQRRSVRPTTSAVLKLDIRNFRILSIGTWCGIERCYLIKNISIGGKRIDFLTSSFRRIRRYISQERLELLLSTVPVLETFGLTHRHIESDGVWCSPHNPIHRSQALKLCQLFGPISLVLLLPILWLGLLCQWLFLPLQPSTPHRQRKSIEKKHLRTPLSRNR